MREISAELITETVAKLCIQACTELPPDVKERIRHCRQLETWSTAKDVLDVIIENFETNGTIPLCQDTGAACVFINVGQDVHIRGDLYNAVHLGVAKGYTEGLLLNYVIITCNPDNIASRKTCEYVGGELLEVVELPEDSDVRERGETQKCIFKFNI